MTFDDFKAYICDLQNDCTAILAGKEGEYGTTDRLIAFKTSCVLTHKTPVETWLSYWSKGIIALYDTIAAKKDINIELIKDGINYLYLLECLLKFENQNVTTDMLLSEAGQSFHFCCDTLVEKAKRYCAGDEDRLGMFKRTAIILRSTPESVLASYMVKHTDSIITMVNNHETDTDLWIEKITDHINYLFLLGALIEDRKRGAV